MSVRNNTIQLPASRIAAATTYSCRQYVSSDHPHRRYAIQNFHSRLWLVIEPAAGERSALPQGACRLLCPGVSGVHQPGGDAREEGLQVGALPALDPGAAADVQRVQRFGAARRQRLDRPANTV